jgi:hypothetical protein
MSLGGLWMIRVLAWVVTFFTARGCYLCKQGRKQHRVIKKGIWGKALLYCQRYRVGVREFEQCYVFKRSWFRKVHFEKGK